MIWVLFVPVMVLAMILVGIVATLAARAHPRVRLAATATALSAVAMPIAIVLHNVVSEWTGSDDTVTFIAALLIAPTGFALGAFALAHDVEQERPRSTMARGFTIGASGVSLMAAYVVFAFLASLFPLRPDVQDAIERLVLPLAAFVTSLGAVMSAIAVVRENTLFAPNAP